MTGATSQGEFVTVDCANPPHGPNGPWVKRGAWLEETDILTNALTRVAAQEVGHGMGLVATTRPDAVSHLEGSTTFPNHNDTTGDLNSPIDGNPVVRVRGQPRYIMFPSAGSSVSGASTFGLRIIPNPAGSGEALLSGGPTAEFLSSNRDYLWAVHH